MALCKEESNPTEDQNFFTKTKKFPNLDENGDVNTALFIEALNEFVQIYDLIGAAFYVAKRDILGNIEKITKTYSKNKEKYNTLHNLVIYEKDDPQLYGVSGLLWLKRALEFTIEFLKLYAATVNDEENGKPINLANMAYKKTLKKYHMWFTQSIFYTIVKTSPTRANLTTAMLLDGNSKEVTMVLDILEYLVPFESNIAAIQKILDKYQLDSDELV